MSKCSSCEFWRKDGVSALSTESVGHCFCLKSEFVGVETTGSMTCKEHKNDLTAFVRDRISEQALYEQVAEEAVELAHAALKVARKQRGENPTPETMEVAEMHFREELADVALVTEILREHPNRDIRDRKLRRWARRLGWEEEK